MKTATLAIRLSPAERAALKKRARAEKVSHGDLVRRALLAYGITAGSEPKKSGHEVIQHLIGRCDGGPADLSTNPDHLADFGQ